MQSLSSVKAGEACEIKWMFGAPAVLEFLSKFGIKEGSQIQVLERSRNDMIIGFGKRRLAVEAGAVKRIMV